MLNYDTELRLQLDAEHAERLVEEMRRSRRLTQDGTGYPSWTRVADLIHRAARLGHKEPKVPAYHA